MSRTRRTPARPRTLPVVRVSADPMTGEWLTTGRTGLRTTRAKWARRPDTHHWAHDFAELPGDGGALESCAVLIVWAWD